MIVVNASFVFRSIGGVALAVSVIAASLAPILRAQVEPTQRYQHPRGFHIALEGWAGHPVVRGDAHAYLMEFGRFGFGRGAAIDLGLDFTHFGVSAGLDAGQTSFDGESPSMTTLSLVGHWMPGNSSARQWRLIFSGGVVTSLIEIGPVPTDAQPTAAPKLYETGARLGVEIARPIAGQIDLTIGAGTDVLSADVRSSSTFPYDLDYDIHHRGWSLFPRVSVRFRWWPFAHAAP